MGVDALKNGGALVRVDLEIWMKKHYAVYYSPGTFFDETDSKPIDQFGDVPEAVEMAATIDQRYGAKPYGFRFVTYIKHDPVVDSESGEKLEVESKKIAESGTYFINGRLRKYDEVVTENHPEESILRGNMRQMPIVVETRNSYRHTAQFKEEDFVVNDLGGIIVRGNDPELVAYRKEVLARIEKERGDKAKGN